MKFAHPSEAEFANILDIYGVKWLYEPRSFSLRWEGDRVTEMFTPDFYLSDLDLYVELTTLRQRLVTEKNRKLRHMRELYPDVNVKLLYKRGLQPPAGQVRLRAAGPGGHPGHRPRPHRGGADPDAGS